MKNEINISKEELKRHAEIIKKTLKETIEEIEGLKKSKDKKNKKST